MLEWALIMLTVNHSIIPLIILIVKICEISLETLRVTFIARNLRWQSSVIYFVEVIIWLNCFGYTINHLESNPLCAVAYALGGAIGVYFGLYIGYFKKQHKKLKENIKK